MFADIGRHMPQEFNDKEQAFGWFKNKQLGMRHSLKLLAREKEYMIIRTPITNENITVYGEPEEIKWLHVELIKADAFSYKL